MKLLSSFQFSLVDKAKIKLNYYGKQIRIQCRALLPYCLTTVLRTLISTTTAMDDESALWRIGVGAKKIVGNEMNTSRNAPNTFQQTHTHSSYGVL